MEGFRERLASLIETLGMTKTAFAEKLNITQPYVTKLLKNGNPSERLFEDICEKFDVNEEWLRNGIGSMFKELPEDEETASLVSDLLEDGKNNPFYEIILEIMHTYNELSPKSQEVLRESSAKLLENLRKKKED